MYPNSINITDAKTGSVRRNNCEYGFSVEESLYEYLIPSQSIVELTLAPENIFTNRIVINGTA